MKTNDELQKSLDRFFVTKFHCNLEKLEMSQDCGGLENYKVEGPGHPTKGQVPGI